MKREKRISQEFTEEYADRLPVGWKVKIETLATADDLYKVQLTRKTHFLGVFYQEELGDWSLAWANQDHDIRRQIQYQIETHVP